MLADSPTTPQFNTTFTEPFYFLEQQFCSDRQKIEKWFEKQWQLTLPPVYGSVDLRNAGFKIAPIDMNLFPAGFNNLNPSFSTAAVNAAKKIIRQIVPNSQKIIIIPESHTRNMFYWQNVQTLKAILEKAGFEVHVGIISDEFKQSRELDLPSGEKILIEVLLRKDDFLCVENFIPDLLLLNNDLSEGIPEILQNIKQPLIPPAELGWSQRLKSEHFQYYAEVVNEFCKEFNIDPWLISPLFKHCGRIDFMQQEGLECLISNTEILFEEIKKKYAEYKINDEPFLIIKADAGTYGMAVMTVRSVDELKNLNRKQRTRMATTKGGQPVNRVILQEGVYTFETIGTDMAVAEPVVYLWGSCVVGGFYRVHKDRGIDESLNAPGMQFEPIAFAHSCSEPSGMEKNLGQNRFFVYGIIAQLSMLAAAREINDLAKK